jgi:hypothetical protein
LTCEMMCALAKAEDFGEKPGFCLCERECDRPYSFSAGSWAGRGGFTNILRKKP